MTSLSGDATKYTAALGTEEPWSRERHRSRNPAASAPVPDDCAGRYSLPRADRGPIVILVRYSLLDNVIVNQHPHFVGLANYTSILSSASFWSAVEHTLIFTVVCVVAQLALGFAFATLLNTKDVGRVTKAVFRVIYILPWMFTAVIVALLWRLLLDPNGVINYLLGLIGVVRTAFPWLATPGWAMACVIVMNIWAGYPFFMITLLAGLQSISPDLYEAARVDGASYSQQLRSVTFRNCALLSSASACSMCSGPHSSSPWYGLRLAEDHWVRPRSWALTSTRWPFKVTCFRRRPRAPFFCFWDLSLSPSSMFAIKGAWR